jgi:hypothetical protein
MASARRPLWDTVSVLSGTLLAESIRVGPELKIDGLVVTKIFRRDFPDEPPGMPTIWTFVEFQAEDSRADELAQKLADVLVAEGGWYADFGVGDDHVVVFAGKVFRYRKGDEAGRAEATEYGLSVGCPADQLDWID